MKMIKQLPFEILLRKKGYCGMVFIILNKIPSEKIEYPKHEKEFSKLIKR